MGGGERPYRRCSQITSHRRTSGGRPRAFVTARRGNGRPTGFQIMRAAAVAAAAAAAARRWVPFPRAHAPRDAEKANSDFTIQNGLFYLFMSGDRIIKSISLSAKRREPQQCVAFPVFPVGGFFGSLLRNFDSIPLALGMFKHYTQY